MWGGHEGGRRCLYLRNASKYPLLSEKPPIRFQTLENIDPPISPEMRRNTTTSLEMMLVEVSRSEPIEGFR